jgi:hypothetical protein
MTRECPVRFCERLGVKLLGATLPPRIVASPEELAPNLSLQARCTLAIVRSDRVQKWQEAVLWLAVFFQ